jgi:hypothetical protein
MARMGSTADMQRGDLEVLRVGLLAAFETADDAVKAQIAGQLRAVIKDLAGLGQEVKVVTVADEITARRQARESDPADLPSAGRRGEPRRGGRSNRTG